MSRFALVESSLWNDPAFLRLSTPARLLFLWSWTHNTAAVCGLYTASLKQMGRVIDRDEQQVRDALGELAHKPLALYDEDSEVLWVVSRVKYANRSPKVLTRMQREVEDVPSSPLVKSFLDRYGDTFG